MKKTKLLMPLVGVAALASVAPTVVSCGKQQQEEEAKEFECELNGVSTGIVASFSFSNNKYVEGEDFTTVVKWTPPTSAPQELYAYTYHIALNNKTLLQNDIENPNGWTVLRHGDNEIEFKIPTHAFDEAVKTSENPKIDFNLELREHELDKEAVLDNWSTTVWRDQEQTTYKGFTKEIDVEANDRVEVEIPLNKWAESKELPQNNFLYFGFEEAGSPGQLLEIQGVGDIYLGLTPLTKRVATIKGMGGGQVLVIEAPTKGWGNVGNLSTINFYFVASQTRTLKLSLIEPNKEMMYYNLVASEQTVTTRSFTYSTKQSAVDEDFISTISWTGIVGEHVYADYFDVYLNGERIYQEGQNDYPYGYHVISKGYNNMTFVFDKELFKGLIETPTISVVFDFDRAQVLKYPDLFEWRNDIQIKDGKFSNVLLSPEFSVPRGGGYIEANIRLANWMLSGKVLGVPTQGKPLYLGIMDCSQGDDFSSAFLVPMTSGAIDNGFRLGQKSILTSTITTAGELPAGLASISVDGGAPWGDPETDIGRLSAINGNILFEEGHSKLRLFVFQPNN